MKNIVWLGIVIFSMMLSCSKMEDEHLKYVRGGELLYVGAPYRVEVVAIPTGVKISFTKTADPSIIKYVIKWNDGQGSIDVIPGDSRVENVEILNLPQGSYTFELTAYDGGGNKSKSAYIAGEVN